MRIRILGAHRCQSKSTGHVCLLIDDTLVIDAGSLTSSLSIADQQKLRAVLLTHQHYDHIRDIPSLALNLALQGSSIKVYSTPKVRAIIESHLLNGEIYPKFHELPEEKPAVILKLVTPYETQMIDGHKILAVPVNHCETTVGYQVSDAKGKAMFYTADTGPGLSDCWKHVSPQLLIVDVTVPDRLEGFARRTGHLTPNLLNKELINFRDLRGYLPQITVVHMDATLEREIKKEIAVIAKALNASITMAHEGMQLDI